MNPDNFTQIWPPPERFSAGICAFLQKCVFERFQADFSQKKACIPSRNVVCCIQQNALDTTYVFCPGVPSPCHLAAPALPLRGAGRPRPHSCFSPRRGRRLFLCHLLHLPSYHLTCLPVQGKQSGGPTCTGPPLCFLWPRCTLCTGAILVIFSRIIPSG